MEHAWHELHCVYIPSNEINAINPNVNILTSYYAKGPNVAVINALTVIDMKGKCTE